MSDENDSWVKQALGLDVPSFLGGGDEASTSTMDTPSAAPPVTAPAPESPSSSFLPTGDATEAPSAAPANFDAGYSPPLQTWGAPAPPMEATAYPAGPPPIDSSLPGRPSGWGPRGDEDYGPQYSPPPTTSPNEPMGPPLPPNWPPAPAPPSSKKEDDEGPQATVKIEPGVKVEKKPGGEKEDDEHKAMATVEVSLSFNSKEQGVFAQRKISVGLKPDGTLSNVSAEINVFEVEVSTKLRKMGALAPLQLFCSISLSGEAELKLKQEEKKTVFDGIDGALKAAFATGVKGTGTIKKFSLTLTAAAGSGGFSVTGGIEIEF